MADEESCPFDGFVHKLKGLVHGKQTTEDSQQCFFVLSHISSIIAGTSKAVLNKSQRDFEDILIKLLLQGASPPVRRLINSCLCDVLRHGKNISMYSRVNDLLGYLAKNVSSNSGVEYEARIGCMECLGALAYAHGSQLAQLLGETITVAARQMRSSDARTRSAALLMVKAVLEGTGGALAEQQQIEALKMAKQGASDRSDVVRMAAGDCLQ
ncbi:hypothetical protein CYMTET_52203, partial [Cymbomonas tetramitiformis]